MRMGRTGGRGGGGGVGIHLAGVLILFPILNIDIYFSFFSLKL